MSVRSLCKPLLASSTSALGPHVGVAVTPDAKAASARRSAQAGIDRHAVLRVKLASSRTAAALPTPSGPKGSSGNRGCRVSGPQKPQRHCPLRLLPFKAVRSASARAVAIKDVSGKIPGFRHCPPKSIFSVKRLCSRAPPCRQEHKQRSLLPPASCGSRSPTARFTGHGQSVCLKRWQLCSFSGSGQPRQG